MTFRVILHRSA